MANAGIVGLDWQQRINWDRLRTYRTERARERMKAHGLGALLLMYDENIRYVTGTAGLRAFRAAAARPIGPRALRVLDEHLAHLAA